MTPLIQFEELLNEICYKFECLEEKYRLVCSTENGKKVLGLLRQYGIVFRVRRSEDARGKPEGRRILWSYGNNEYLRTPFSVMKTVDFVCQKGAQYQKSRRGEVHQDNPNGKKTRTRKKPSKKVGCPARMKMTLVQTFPEYKLTEDMTKNIHDLKGKMMKRLKTALLGDTLDVCTQDLYFITVSKLSVHSHPILLTTATPPSEPSNSVQNSYVESSFIERVQEITKEMYDASFLLDMNLGNSIDISQCLEKLNDARSSMNKFIQSNKCIQSINHITVLPTCSPELPCKRRRNQ